MTKPLAAIAAFLPLLSGCGSLFESKLSAPQTYVLRLPRSTAEAGALTAGSVRVQRPEAGPGLDSNRIALLRTDRRFDYYAASLWAAPAPDVVESVIVDALRDTQSFSAVFDDAAPFAPRYDLRCTMRRFEADYTAGEGAPTAWVALDCTLGRHRDRVLLTSFTAQASAPAREDRMTAVVAAFEAATLTVMNDVSRAITSAIAAEKTPAAEAAR